MAVRLNGSTSGYTELDAPAVAGNNTLKMPTSNGSAGQSMTTDGSGNLSFGSSIVSGTSQASTSGTSIDFTGIPSWAKRVTVILSGVSTNGSSNIRIRLGSGSVQTTGYNSRGTAGTTGWNSVVSTAGGFDVANNGSANFVDGHIVFHNPAANTWIAAGLMTSDFPAIVWTGGNVGLSGTLDRIRITTANGTDTFDAGTINLLWE